jgi:hypothetical protein
MLEHLREKLNTRARSEILRAKFAAIYYRGLWGTRESRSGAGSVRDSLSVMVAGVAIAEVVRDYGVRSISDIPCGDFNWMPDVLASLGEVSYAGFDIVKTIVLRNKERRPDCEFRVLARLRGLGQFPSFRIKEISTLT